MGYVPPAPGYILTTPSELTQADVERIRARFASLVGGPSAGAPIRLNLDRHGMPRDYATYVWLLYKREVADDSPARRAFLGRRDV